MRWPRFRVRTLMGLVALVAVLLWGVPTAWRWASYSQKARRFAKVAAIATWRAEDLESFAQRSESPLPIALKWEADCREVAAEARAHEAIYRDAMTHPWMPLRHEPWMFQVPEWLEEAYDRHRRSDSPAPAPD